MTATTTRPPTTEADLAEAGFTPEQIEMLQELREIYPLPEFLETVEVRRLAFVKWRRQQVSADAI